MDIRKTVILIEETFAVGGKTSGQPIRQVAAMVVVRNPLVARNDENLGELVRDGEDLGRVLARRVAEHIDRKSIVAVGKAAIIGMDGEPEHGQAILFPKFESAVRETLDLTSIHMFGEKRILAAGQPIEVTLQSVSAEAVGPAFKMELRVPGSPRSDEILVALVVAGPAGPA